LAFLRVHLIMVLLVEPGGLLSVLAHRLGSLLDGLSAMLYVLLADLRDRIQSLLVERHRRVEDLRIHVGPLLRERLEGLPLALDRRSESFAGSWDGCAASVRDLDY
jgi:hypothetical protein